MNKKHILISDNFCKVFPLLKRLSSFKKYFSYTSKVKALHRVLKETNKRIQIVLKAVIS